MFSSSSSPFTCSRTHRSTRCPFNHRRQPGRTPDVAFKGPFPQKLTRSTRRPPAARTQHLGPLCSSRSRQVLPLPTCPGGAARGAALCRRGPAAPGRAAAVPARGAPRRFPHSPARPGRPGAAPGPAPAPAGRRRRRGRPVRWPG